jgi:hypothetical protein
MTDYNSIFWTDDDGIPPPDEKCGINMYDGPIVGKCDEKECPYIGKWMCESCLSKCNCGNRICKGCYIIRSIEICTECQEESSEESEEVTPDLTPLGSHECEFEKGRCIECDVKDVCEDCQNYKWKELCDKCKDNYICRNCYVRCLRCGDVCCAWCQNFEDYKTNEELCDKCDDEITSKDDFIE